MPRLFVYGTLMRGEANHAQLAGARLAGPARSAPLYTLVDLGDYPAMVAGGRDSIRGELYEVDAAQLAAVDAFEEHPDVYVRSSIVLEDGREALAYLLPAGQARGARIDGGDWRGRLRSDGTRDR